MTYAPRTRPLLASVLATALLSCTPPPDTTDPELRIGLLAALEGEFTEASGRPSVRGAEMAAEEINARGGVSIGGIPHRVRIVTRSYDGRPDEASIQGRALINQHGIHALVGPQLSAHAIPVGVVAEAAGLPMISPMSSNPLTTAGKRWVFRLAFLDDFQGEVLGHFATGELGARRGAVLLDVSSQYSRDLARRFQESFVHGGGTVVAVEEFTSDRGASFRDQLARIAATDPDVLFLPNHAQFDSIQMREARELGIDAVFLGSDVWDLLNLPGKPYAEGAFVTHQWHYSQAGENVAAFLQRYRERHEGALPRSTAAMTYDAVHIIAAAAAAAGTLAPEGIRAGIAGTEGFKGATGTISFRGSGDPRRSAVISRVDATSVSFYRVVDP